MQKQNKKGTKRLRNMFFICSLIAIVVSVSTYAWFIGMRTVNVSSFDVQIASTDSLELSLDGHIWDTTVSITDQNYSSTYNGNTNTWGGNGLIPMSSIGDMDSAASRLILYEKASLTATPGGYRLLASRIDNSDTTPGKPEKGGFVAFDLFIKNFSGNKYYKELDPGNEEAVYLTTDSQALASDAGVDGTGIENSVRVAFTEIGRVSAPTIDQGIITGITCEPDADGNPSVKGDVTGICRTAQIWEPNDTSHVDSAISWYKTSCLKRIGADITKKTSYSGSCRTVVNGIGYPTYAIGSAITSEDKVDIYDGAIYNGYTVDTNDVPTNPNAKLIAYPYFTDTMSLLAGLDRPPFMTLAPNSITKLRIYIYIEGQDIDNYDFAQIGKAITINFGFTKERFTPDDINYDGPEVNQGEGPNGADLTPPVITLNGTNPVRITQGGTYIESGATAYDSRDGDEPVTITGTVNTAEPGSYTIIYKATDSVGNLATKTRTVIVEKLEQ